MRTLLIIYAYLIAGSFTFNVSGELVTQHLQEMAGIRANVVESFGGDGSGRREAESLELDLDRVLDGQHDLQEEANKILRKEE